MPFSCPLLVLYVEKYVCVCLIFAIFFSIKDLQNILKSVRDLDHVYIFQIFF